MLADVGVPEATSVGEGQAKLWRTSRQWPERPWGSQAKTGQDFWATVASVVKPHAHSLFTSRAEQDVGAEGALKKVRP